MSALLGLLAVLLATTASAQMSSLQCPLRASEPDLVFAVRKEGTHVDLYRKGAPPGSKALCVISLHDCVLGENATRISYEVKPNPLTPNSAWMTDMTSVEARYADGTSKRCPVRTVMVPIEFKMPPLPPPPKLDLGPVPGTPKPDPSK
jgi:hypothetical protein